MKEYTGDRIRNVAIVGHGGAGNDVCYRKPYCIVREQFPECAR